MTWFSFSVPDNKFEKSGKLVIDEKEVTNIGQTTIQIALNLDFFENQNENGLPVEDGIIVYVNEQTLYTGMAHFELH